MQTAILVLTLATLSYTAGDNLHSVVKAIKAVHHHTTSVVYKKVIKPVAKQLGRD